MKDPIIEKGTINLSHFLNTLNRKWVGLCLAFLAFAWAIVVSEILFPFYSNNHDEPVYILQAQTLLGGRLTLPTNEFFDDFFSNDNFFGHP